MLKQFLSRNNNKSKNRSKSQNKRLNKSLRANRGEIIWQATKTTRQKYPDSPNIHITNKSKVLLRTLTRMRTWCHRY